ncbi:MAG: DNA helicase PcrA [Candidatus Nanopelagicales bacterium]|nr:DNA helicase PcrA [Candidatus Nanopelagicales bacterium]
MLLDDPLPRLPRATLPPEDLDLATDAAADDLPATAPSTPAAARPADVVRAALAARAGGVPAGPASPPATSPRRAGRSVPDEAALFAVEPATSQGAPDEAAARDRAADLLRAAADATREGADDRREQARAQREAERAASIAALVADLNPPQRQAVEHRGAPLLIVAGAGSGKTRVLTRRIAHLLATGDARPGEILAITFTNKAAAEMRERVEAAVGPRARVMWVSTFHSACVRLLRRESDRLGLKSNFSIYDQADSIRLVTLVARDLDLDVKRTPPRGLLHRISALKNELVDHETFRSRAANPTEEQLADVYAAYQQRLARAQAVDFDDLIGHTVALLEGFPDVAEHYRRRFRHILVDEYQDTNHAQYRLIAELVGRPGGEVPPGELVVVGDSDQSIYAFRGATVRNIVEFGADFPDARQIVLDQNYRSTQTILSAANAVIARNPDRQAKTLWTDAGQGEPIVGYVADNEHDEAAFVGNEIDRLADLGAARPGDVAVFYRTNAQSRALEEVFIRTGMPYKVVGGTRFYERREIRDVLAYLRVVANPADDVSLRRILNVPKRGIGDRAEAWVADFAAAERITFGEALRRAGEIPGMAGRSANAVAAFAAVLDDLAAVVDSGASIAELMHAVLERSGYLAELQASDDPQDEVRVENVAEFEAVAAEFAREAEEAGGSPGSLADFLERVALVADADEIPEGEDHEGVVTLMTLHTAKGLEFPVVFLTGMEDGVFPHMRAMTDPFELSEERRLAYVGLTRARQRLYLTRSIQRSAWGAPSYNPESRFLADIPAELLRWEREEPKRSSSPSAGGFGAAPALAAAAARPGARTTGNRPVVSLAAGDRVLHPKFGMGTVVTTSGSGDQAEASVDFGSEGVKRLLLRYAPVEKL